MGIMLLISVVVVAFFVVGMSLTLIFKGHHIDSEIGDNKNMQALGIECAARQMREEEGRGSRQPAPEECDTYGCATCRTGSCANTVEQGF